MTHITRVLAAVNAGDAKAAEELFPLIYHELCKVAVGKMAQELPGQTLQATELVHEAWLPPGRQPAAVAEPGAFLRRRG